jgi:membrane associated rhomboid family serine protease
MRRPLGAPDEVCNVRGVLTILLRLLAALPLRDHLPTRTTPFVNTMLIFANIGVFVWEFLQFGHSPHQAEAFTRAFALIPARFFVDPNWGLVTVFTSMFMHEGIAHVGFNMLFLWIFGDNVEDAMGHARYLLFYLVGGVCAAAAQTLVDPTSTIPMVGASGAISAVLAAYVFLYPRSPITVLNPIILLWLFFGLTMTFPAWLVIGIFFGTNLYSALTTHAAGGVAFMAHVGGFLGGTVLYRAFLAGRERLDEYARWERWARRRGRGDGWA